MGRTAWIGSGAAVLVAAAALAAPAAHAQSAYSSVYTNPPLITQPAPVIVQPAPVRTWVPGHWEVSQFGNVWVEGHWIVVQQPQFGQQFHFQHHHQHWQGQQWQGQQWQGARFDQDRDGVPNRMDRDIDGDGVPNWRDRAPRNARVR